MFDTNRFRVAVVSLDEGVVEAAESHATVHRCELAANLRSLVREAGGPFVDAGVVCVEATLMHHRNDETGQSEEKDQQIEPEWWAAGTHALEISILVRFGVGRIEVLSCPCTENTSALFSCAR